MKVFSGLKNHPENEEFLLPSGAKYYKKGFVGLISGYKADGSDTTDTLVSLIKTWALPA